MILYFERILLKLRPFDSFCFEYASVCYELIWSLTDGE